MTLYKQFFLLTLVLCIWGIVSSEAQPHPVVQLAEQGLRSKDIKEQVQAYGVLITYYGGSDPQKARALSKGLVQLGVRSKKPSIVALGLGEQGNVLRRLGQRDSAFLLLHQAHKMAASTDDDHTQGQIAYRLGMYHDAARPDSARFYYQQAAKMYERAHEEHLVAFALGRESGLLREMGKMDSAKLLLDEAAARVNQVLRSDSSYWPARAAATIASSYGLYNNSVSRFEESLRWNLRSLRFFESVGDLQAQGAVLHTMGTTYRQLLKHERAIDQFRRALPRFDAVHDRGGMEACYESMALVFEDRKMADSAEYYYNKALDKAIELKSTVMQANIYNNMGGFNYTLRKDYAKAASFYEKAFTLRGGAAGANLNHRATAMINLGQVAVKLGNLSRAGDYLSQGLSLARELQSPVYEKSALEGMVMYHTAREDFRSASRYQDSLLTLKDSIYITDSKSKVAEMEVRFETERKEQEILLLKSEARIANIKQYAWMAAFFVAIVVALLVASSFYHRRARIQAELALAQKEKEVIQSEVRYKDRELVNLATYITEKNTFMESILQTLDEIDVKHDGAQRHLEKLAPLIRDHINLSGSRDEFEAYMTTVYGGFIKKLEERYPGLTEYEKRLATLLRVNLSSKQIATVLNISPKSVDMSRYRLRKKMGLTVDQDIPEALTTL